MIATKPYISDEWLEYENTHGGRFCLGGDIQSIQKQVQHLIQQKFNSEKQIPKSDLLVVVEDLYMNGVPVRLYRPVGEEPEYPVCIFSHGGGWCTGDLESEDAFCRWIAERIPCIVVSVDYRLGPQYKLPAMLDDVVAVYEWARVQEYNFAARSLLTDGQVCRAENGLLQISRKLFALGGSAGGANSLALCNYIAEKARQGIAKRKLDGVIAIAPVTLHPDFIPPAVQERYQSYQRNGEDVPIMDGRTMMTYFDATNANPKDSSIFTGLSRHHSGFPRTFIAICGADPLEDDGSIMADMLCKAGVPTMLDSNPGMPHLFWIFDDFGPAQDFRGRLLQGIRFVLGDSEYKLDD